MRASSSVAAVRTEKLVTENGDSSGKSEVEVATK
jgi:hypothetical protein